MSDNTRTCVIDACPGSVIAHGLCFRHYQRRRRTGTTDGVDRRLPDARSEAERFWSRVDQLAPGECWLWQGQVTDSGYGVHFRYGFRAGKVRAHRLAYELTRGAIQPGMTIDHLCYTRRCVNPDHLEEVTLAENTCRAWARRKVLSGAQVIVKS